MTRKELEFIISEVRDAGKINSFFMRCRDACGIRQVRGKCEELDAAFDSLEYVGSIGDNMPIEYIAFYSDDHVNIYVEKESYDYVNGYSFESHQHINMPYIWDGKFKDLRK